MRRKLAGIALLGLVIQATPLQAVDFVGVNGGIAQPLSRTGDFASGGGVVELRWRHQNRGRSAWEFVAGYAQMGLEGEVQNTIAAYALRQRQKNELAQEQGGPGNGFLIAEYGTFETFYGGANLLFQPWHNQYLAPFLSVGGGVYNWRVPFRIEWNRTPFFGEQHAWEAPHAESPYAGVIWNEAIDYTKHNTSGGVNAALGSTVRVTRRVQIDLQARAHLVFSSGAGDREEGIDDQDYLDLFRFVFLNAGLNYRF